MTRQLDDWLESYLQFTQNAESPTQYHVWSGLTAISSCLQRKCYTNWGLRGYTYPNLYVALVGPPGGRKGTAMKIAKNMLAPLEANKQLRLGSDALGSVQRLYKEIMEAENEYPEFDGKIKKHKSLSIWSEEFQVFLSDKDPMFIASITDLFDCADSWKYSTLKRSEEDLSNCWLTIIGAITPSLLQTKLSQEMVGGGLASRIIFVVGYGAKHRKALQFLSKEDKKLQQKLMQDLEQISLLSGPFRLTNSFLKEYVHWYEQVSAGTGVDSEKFVGYNARRALHMNKLVMLFSASESDSMDIEDRHFKKALAVLEEAEREMPNAFYGLGRGDHSEIYTSILRWIESKDSFSWGDVMQRFQLDALPHELQQYMTMLDSTKRVKTENSATGSRYIVIQKDQEVIDNSYLKSTLYRRMV